jgi:hypothetical protein
VIDLVVLENFIVFVMANNLETPDIPNIIDFASFGVFPLSYLIALLIFYIPIVWKRRNRPEGILINLILTSKVYPIQDEIFKGRSPKFEV